MPRRKQKLTPIGDAPDSILNMRDRPLWPPSPKVWGPVILILVGIGVHSWSTHTFDTAEIVGTLVTLLFGGTAYAIPDNKPVRKVYHPSGDIHHEDEPDHRHEKTHPPALD